MGSEREKTKNPVKKDTRDLPPGGGEYKSELLPAMMQEMDFLVFVSYSSR